jgi:predicted membrane protein DUF2207
LGRARAGLAVALLALAVPAAAAAKLTGVPTAHAVFTLDPDGVLQVLEQMNVRADDPTATTWQVTMQRGELFAQPSLVVDEQRYRPGGGKRPGTFLISRGTRGVRFDWLQPEGTHSVRLAYRLALFGTAYTDVVDLRVPVWERDWPVPVRELTASLRLPRIPHGRVIVWFEPSTLGTTIAKSGRQIRVRIRDVGAKSPLTMRTLLPRNVLSSLDGVNVQEKPGLAAILDERNGGNRRWWPWALAATVVLAVSAVVLRTARSRLPRRR